MGAESIMTGYIIRRILLVVPTVLIVTVMLFAVIRLTPGDPATIEFGVEVRPEQVEAVRKDLGLDRPLPVQYASWLSRMFRGDFGRSTRERRPVLDAVKERLPATLQLSIVAFVVGIGVAIPLGTYCAIRPHSWFAKTTTVLTLASIAVPGFFFSTMLVFFFTYKWRIVETPRYVPFSEDPLTNLRNLVLPVIALSHGTIAVFTRFVRSSVLEVLHNDYIRTARSKGLSEWSVVGVHALRNAMIPSVTLIGLSLFLLWDGALITERIFNWPGVGRLTFNALTNKDFPVIQAVVFLSALSVCLGNLFVDLLYAALDPRISYVSRR